ncbi:MAG: hypothetical protein GQ535_01050 [Rhodobacteraceae bacterium]|nr:hypothetical protein [Paracoccaceae bacterium]
MLKTILVLAAFAAPAFAQTTHTEGMVHVDGMHSDEPAMAMAGMGATGTPLVEGGQSAFSAIAEVVAALQADPSTDWSVVDIDGLRDHLRDMDIVTIDSRSVASEIEGGLRFDVTGEGEVVAAIRRMARAHAGMMDGADGWNYSTVDIPNGAALSVTVFEASDLAMLKGLGFYGIMASGMHHQTHHWAMASGADPHAH